MKPLRSFISVIALCLLSACGSSAGPAPVSQAAAGSPAASPPSAEPATASPPCTSAGPASADWPAAASMLAGRPAITAAVAGDTLTLGFERGTPAFEVRPQPSARFSRDPSGKPVTLSGSAGVAIVLRGFRGDTRNYAGPLLLTVGGPVLREVQEIGDSEGVVTWAAGLAVAGCASVSTGGSTLAVHFVPAPAPATAMASAGLADIEAVARQVYRGGYPVGCSMNDPSCPLTPRLAARVFAVSSHKASGPGPLNAFCRCQNPASRTMSVSGEATPTGGVAHVTLYPDVHPIRIDLIVVEEDGRLLVDDMQCTGKGPATSVYAAQLVACG